MDTIQNVTTSGSTFGDLFGPDERAIKTALETLGDGDLLLAAIVINTQPIYPGTDERLTAMRLADIFAHAKTPSGASQIAYALFEHVRPDLVMVGLCLKTGVSDKVITVIGKTRDLPSFYAQHILGLPNHQVFFNAALAAEIRRTRTILSKHVSMGLLIELLKHSDDVNIILEAAKFHDNEVSVPALKRLIDLEASEAIDSLVRDGSFSSRYKTDTHCKLAISHASKETHLMLAKSHNLGFIYRREATRHLSSTELLHIAEGSRHENVRNSANRELAVRGVIEVSDNEFRQL